MDSNKNTRSEYVSPACRVRETELVYMYLQQISGWGDDPEVL